MSVTWDDADVPPPRRFGPGDWLRVVLRGLCVGTLVFGGLALLLLVRLVERPFCGLHRPVTPFITVAVCKGALRLLGLPLHVKGSPMTGQGAIVANHASWLDIFVLNASKRIYFVSKSEVASWPGIGWLARATGTVFVVRDPRRAAEQTQTFQDRLLAGHKLLFFPEGTSTDGLRVLPFKPTLFQAFFAPELRGTLKVQPVTVTYHAPDKADARFYGWWGDMEFASHLLSTLAAPRQGRVEVVYHAPLKVSDFADRKALAAAAEETVRGAHALAVAG
ncbi:lysophospholipid acyltransferase family protein [Pseudosulfitobacter koreensis]|uniref:1-acyl-sn-glycerol-3-phosphate acyltransferase n=1 Tax=Pseudosulfitobacter koreensis TaxID=2968472 RepID=A0ABT1Z0A7_9RHOB|nr:lysophospholipid acyltransferase family protein [Pseudosulfitobacter koreense]MCR8826575.1 1-acyl-sn-glycerol-3-phosphate acyltransferase [Pseudosulfitobacter koreense]